MTELYMFYKLIHNFFIAICLLILTSNQAFADNSVKDFFYNKIPIISDLIFEKYTVEELGYLDDFGQSLNEINNLSVPLYKELNVKKSFEDISNDLNEKEILEQKEEEINRYITKLNEISEKIKNQLQETLPPEEILEVHNDLIKLLTITDKNTFEKSEDSFLSRIRSKVLYKNYKIYNESEIANSLKKLYNSYNKFSENVSNRSYEEQEKLYMLYYSPPGAPFGFSVDSKGAFSVKFKKTTPIGDFAVGRSASEGVKELILISHGKKRKYLLDGKAFEFYVPTNKGFKVNYKDNKLTIYVE